MGKFWKILFSLVLAGIFVFVNSVYRDRQTLTDEIIRLHIVAASDDTQDQDLKLQIRDAILEYLSDGIAKLPSAEEAKLYLLQQLEEVKDVVTRVIQKEGFDYSVTVTLEKEAFDSRIYDTFTLPAGVYNALRIVIGPGTGRNWWCVVFPGLCLPKQTQQTASVAAGAGFSDTLTGSITRQEGYEVRFWLLDTWGKIQNFLFKG